MEIVLLLVLIGLMTFGYSGWQDKRERDLAARLAAVHDRHEASVLLDTAVAQSRHEAAFFGNLRDHR